MRAAWAMFRTRTALLLQYRAAAAAGLATQIFWGTLRVLVIEAFFRSAPGPHPMTLIQVTTYVWLGQAMLRMLPAAPDPDVRQMVRNGSIACELLRPADLFALWYARALAACVAPTLLRAGPLLLIAWVFFGIELPASLPAAALWTLATASAFALAAGFIALQGVLLLYTVTGNGAAKILASLGWLGSGMLVPLPLLPDGVRWIAERLPFAGLMDVPFRLWTGHLPAPEGLRWIALQVFWTVVIIVTGRRMLASRLARLEVHGG